MGLFARLKRSLENPSTPLSAADDWLYDALGAYRASSGVSVNRETALTYAAVWRAVNLLAKDVGKLPLHVMRHDGDGKRKKDRKHPAYRLLRRSPNVEMGASTLKSTLMVGALLEGNGYGYIVRDAEMYPEEIIPLHPHSTYPVRVNGVLWYIYEREEVVRRIPAADIIHIKGISYDGLIGYSVISKARESIGLGMAMQTYGSVYFRNSAQPSVILEHPGRLTPEAAKNLRESWERLHTGIENAHRTAVLEEGMTARALTINARDSQLIEQRKYELTEIANWFGVPSHKVGGEGRTAYASLEQENQAYLDDGLSPWLVAWEEECSRKLLMEHEQDTHYVEFSRRHLQRADLTARTQYYVQGLTNGWLCPDDVRAEEGMNPLPDDKGKEFRVPLNTSEIGSTPPDKGDDDG